MDDGNYNRDYDQEAERIFAASEQLADQYWGTYAPSGNRQEYAGSGNVPAAAENADEYEDGYDGDSNGEKSPNLREYGAGAKNSTDSSLSDTVAAKLNYLRRTNRLQLIKDYFAFRRKVKRNTPFMQRASMFFIILALFVYFCAPLVEKIVPSGIQGGDLPNVETEAAMSTDPNPDYRQMVSNTSGRLETTEHTESSAALAETEAKAEASSTQRTDDQNLSKEESDVSVLSDEEKAALRDLFNNILNEN